MDIQDFSRLNAARCRSSDGFDQPIETWSLSDWMTATFGELGEAANIVKKLNRLRDGIVNPGGESERELRLELSKEIADTFCYLDLLATAAGIDLQTAVIQKFNEVSRRIGYQQELPL